jgi:diguanylate cyclase (GGDEF)-like protein
MPGDLTASKAPREREGLSPASGGPSRSRTKSRSARSPLRSRTVRALILLGVLLVGSIIGGTWLLLLGLRNRAIADSERQLQNVALVLAEQSDRSFQAIELIQHSIIDRIRSLGIETDGELERHMSTFEVHSIFKDKIVGLTHVDSIALFDSRGKLVNFSRYWPLPPIDVADRDYFKALASTSRVDSVISEPLLNRANGTWTIFLARRIVDERTGKFMGVVLGAMGLQYFEQLFAKITLGSDSSIGLFRDDGVLLVRYPRRDSPGSSYASNGMFMKVLAQGEGGLVRGASTIDGKERLIAAHRLPHYPVVVGTGTTVSAALADWRHQAITMSSAAALLACVIGGVIFLCGRHVTRRLQRQYVRLDTAINNMQQGLLMFDGRARLVVCNQRYIQMYGLSPEIARPGCTLRALIEHRKEMGSLPGDPQQYVSTILSKVARRKPANNIVETTSGRVVFIAHQPMLDGGWVVTHEDITERWHAEKKIAYMAHHDALTDLPNRVLLRERLEEALSRVRQGERLAVLYLDLDHFKRINDTFGHAVGDELLQAVAERLKDCVREIDTVARLGGDEFAIIQTALQDPAQAIDLSEQLRNAIKVPYESQEHRLVVDVSIGIAFSPDDGNDADDLLKKADIALHSAKTAGRGLGCCFEPELDARMRARHTLEAELRNAITNGELELHYQPQVNLERNEISGVEALLRWRHPERGMVPPEEFISIAEEAGLIVQIGEWSLRQACADAAGWPDHIKVAVNLSPLQLAGKNLVQTVISALAGSGLPSSRLELEITETVLMRNTFATLDMLRQLRELGVRIAMDDFGTGYSSLSYLQSFPFDKIKIDRSFINDLSENDISLAIVRAIITLADSSGMTTTAEGVETEQQMERVRELGCTEMQGYLFSAARPAAEISQLCRSRGRRTASAA